jgi:hypothetical protein
MYSDVKATSLLRGPLAKALPVTGAMLIGWNIVAAAVLISVGLALLSISRVLISRVRSHEGLLVTPLVPVEDRRHVAVADH